MSANPIGIFDSGIGGLTVAQAINKLLPNENLIYFGDTCHTPWGDKSKLTIEHYVSTICDFLLEQKSKVIVIACNTASAIAYNYIKKYVGERALVVNVIDPTIEHIANLMKPSSETNCETELSAHAKLNYASNSSCNSNLNHSLEFSSHLEPTKIGLIGTKQTIASESYATKISNLNKNIQLQALATPLLVNLIEEGFAEKLPCKLILEEYLSDPILNKIEALILGCTHYPLLKARINDFYQGKVHLIDSADQTALVLQRLLHTEKLANFAAADASNKFFISDYNPHFVKMARQLFSNYTLNPHNLW